jgi:predicted HicB family RNase H-like nuclease
MKPSKLNLTESKSRTVAVRISNDDYKQLRLIAAERDVSLSSLVREHVETLALKKLPKSR